MLDIYRRRLIESRKEMNRHRVGMFRRIVFAASALVSLAFFAPSSQTDRLMLFPQ